MTAVVAAGALALPAAATAGGWATVELSSTPDGLGPGQAWNVELQVKAHGVTPADGLEPAITIAGPSGAPRTFAAGPAGEAGWYEARVVFPQAGEWQYEIDDGYSQVHTYPAVRIGGNGAASSAPARPAEPAGDGAPWTALLAALGAGLTTAGLTSVALRRRDRRRPAITPS